MGANFMLLDSSFARLKAALADERPGSEVSQLVAHVEACLRQSQRFVEDLAGLARCGAIAMDPERVEVGDVWEEVLFEQRELIARRHVEVDLQRPLPGAWCHRDRLKQVITNLLRNALKHGCDPQRPRIVVSCARGKAVASEASQDNLVAFQIHDNGPGVPRAYREEIFLPGRRLTPTDDEGSGMGLAIVKRIVEHYGGAVWVDDDGLPGATFVVVLPAPPTESYRSTSPGRCLGHDAPHEEPRLHSHQPFLGPIDVRGSR